MKKAILAVSFGTSHMDTLEKTILPIEQELAAAFPERTLYRAFTSGVIIRKLKRLGLLEVDTVEQALARMYNDGITDVLVQPSHIINGEEYELLRETLRMWEERFFSLKLGKPLLTFAEDYYRFAEAILAELPPAEQGKAFLLLGHGSEHPANSAYCQLEYVLWDMGRTDVVIGTVEGYPAFEQAEKYLTHLRTVKQVTCLPLLIVAGDHAKNDMSGDEPDSWKSRFTAAGYEVSCVLKGLGEYAGIREMIVAHAKAAEMAAPREE